MLNKWLQIALVLVLWMKAGLCGKQFRAAHWKKLCYSNWIAYYRTSRIGSMFYLKEPPSPYPPNNILMSAKSSYCTHFMTAPQQYKQLFKFNLCAENTFMQKTNPVFPLSSWDTHPRAGRGVGGWEIRSRNRNVSFSFLVLVIPQIRSHPHRRSNGFNQHFSEIGGQKSDESWGCFQPTDQMVICFSPNS